MVAPFAAPGDLEAIWRPLTDAETVVAAGLLDAASQVIVEIPAVAVRILAGTVADATLRFVCAQMVQRVMLNPERLKQYTVTSDDSTESGVYADAVLTGELMISASEMDRLLGRIPVGAQPGAFSVLQPWLLEPAVTPETVYPWDWSTRIVDPSA